MTYFGNCIKKSRPADEYEYGVKYSRDGKKLLKASFLSLCEKEYVVREGTEVICDGALKSTGIRSVKLPSTIISIGSVACANIPASVKYFSSCESLQSVTIPNSVTSIGGLAFYLCTHLDEPSRLRLKELNCESTFKSGLV